MNRTVFLNGEYLPEEKAKLPIFDRGLLFADAVYEGLDVLDGQIINFPMHMARLRRSLGELSMPEPMTQNEFFIALMRLIRENGVEEGFLYLHVTRGVADRDFLYSDDLSPNVFAFTQEPTSQRLDDPPRAMKLHSTPDLRWARRDIKTSNLLGQVLAKTAARTAGAGEALLIDQEGFVTEGASSSFFIVKDGVILARPVSNDILHGVTRQAMLAVAEAEGIGIERRRFSLDDVHAADEAFLTGSPSYLDPVCAVDGRMIGNGEPGPITLRLRQECLRRARASFYSPN